MGALASVFVDVRPQTDRFEPDLKRKLGAVNGEKLGNQLGSRIGSGIHSAIARVGKQPFAFLATSAKLASVSLGAAAVTAAGFGLKTAASMETARIGFTTMLGSAKKADTFLKQLQKFAAATPFEFPELQTAASSLISVGIDAKKVIPIMTTLGNVTSGMGTGSEGIKRATIALQQMSAAGKITGEDLNQLRDAGIPVFDLLSAATGKTKAEVVKLAQAGKLGKKELDQMMGALESGKGLERFNGLMEKQSHSLSGLFSTLKDNVSMTLSNLVTPAIPAIKSGLNLVSNLIASAAPHVLAFFGTMQKEISAGLTAVKEGLNDKIPTTGGVLAWITTTTTSIKNFSGWVKDTGIPAISKAFTTIKLDLSPIAASFVTQATGWGSAIITGVKTGLDTGDWSGLGTTVGKGIASAVEGAGRFAKDIASKIGDLLSKVDWVGIGIAVGKQVPSLLIGLAAGILNFDLMGLLKGLAQHWQDVLMAIIAVAFTPAKVLGKVGEVLARIPLVGKLLAWGLKHFADFSKGLVRMVGDALGFMGKAFIEGFQRIFPGVGTKFFAHLRNLPTYVGVVALEVVAKAKLLMKGLGDSIAGGIARVVAKIGELIARMLRPFVNAGGWLLRRGAEFVSGLIRGVAGKIGDAAGAAGRIVTAVKGKFTGAASWLLHAGGDVVHGLLDGARAELSKVAQWAKDIGNSIISAVKGFFGIHSPSTVFAGIGGHLMSGLAKGMLAHDPVALVGKVFGGMTGALRALFSKGIISATANLGGKALSALGGLAGNIFGGGGAPASVSGNAAIVKGTAAALFGWTGAEWDALYKLVNRESGFNNTAQNPTSTAFGLFQFLDGTWAGFGPKTPNPTLQTRYGLQYIKQRYGDPINAWGHEMQVGWYGAGMPPTVFDRPTLIGVGERGPETVSVTRGDSSGGGLSVAALVSALTQVRLVVEGDTARFVAGRIATAGTRGRGR